MFRRANNNNISIRKIEFKTKIATKHKRDIL